VQQRSNWASFSHANSVKAWEPCLWLLRNCCLYVSGTSSYAFTLNCIIPGALFNWHGGVDFTSFAWPPATTGHGSGKNSWLTSDQHPPGGCHRPSVPTCYYCRRKGHIMSECWEYEKKKTKAVALVSVLEKKSRGMLCSGESAKPYRGEASSNLYVVGHRCHSIFTSRPFPALVRQNSHWFSGLNTGSRIPVPLYKVYLSSDGNSNCGSASYTSFRRSVIYIGELPSWWEGGVQFACGKINVNSTNSECENGPHLQTDFGTLNVTVIVTLNSDLPRYKSNLLTTVAYNMLELLQNIQ